MSVSWRRKIYSLLTEQDEKLKKIHQEQAQLLQQPQLEVYNALSAQQRTLKEQMDAEVRALTQLNQQVFSHVLFVRNQQLWV